jgi:hypothetical protein
MSEHILKVLSPDWRAIERGDQTFLVHHNDRDFQLGDIVVLKLIEAGVFAPTIAGLPELRKRISYIVAGAANVFMSLEDELVHSDE